MTDTPYPKINGSIHDFTSCDFRLIASRVTGIMSVDYKVEKKGKMIYGASVLPIARTRGTAAFSGSMEVLLSTYYRIKEGILALQGRGILDQEWQFQIAYGPNSTDAHTDTLISCRFENVPKGPKQGDDAVMVKLDFSFMNLLEDGVPVVAVQLKLKL